MEENMHFCSDTVLDIRNAPLKQIAWEWDWSTANDQNGPVDLHPISREGQHHLGRRVSGG